MNAYRIIVTGSRDWTDRDVIVRELTSAMSIGPGDRDFVIIQGGARGADSLAAEWVRSRRGIALETFGAEWNKHGKAAGPIRNRRMLDAGADVVLAFPLGGRSVSPGTWDCIEAAVERGIPVRISARASLEETKAAQP